jgi:hypothetical protein
VTEKKKLFRITQPDEIRVKIDLEQDGETIETVHVFRALTAKDKKEFYARSSYTELTGGVQRQMSGALDASEALYDSAIKQVEGVDFEGVADWKAAVPIEIKRFAVTLLLGQIGFVSGEVLKN